VITGGTAWAWRVLADNYTDDGCRIWWHSHNQNTGGIPAQQWSGDPAERAAVVRELERLDGGGEA
jgi:hypothetical protein